MKSVLITSSILILLLAALRPLLRGRIDPRLQYALWLIIALRLLVPVELATSAYSALALLDRAEGPARAAQAIGRTTVPIPAMSYEEAFDQALSELQQEQTITTSFTDLDQVDSRAQELLKQGPTLAQLFEKYARPLWLGGAALAGLWFLLVNLRFRRRLRAAELAVIDPSTKLPVYVSDALLSPCLCGTFRPAIYITPHTVQDPDRLRHVLAHESAHYRHRDHWWALVRCLCLCLYWFDPLVWWAAALSRQDCELACDAGAIRRLGEKERIPYGRTLVDMIAAGRCSLMQTATTMTGGRRRVRERVRLIARKPKTVIAVALALVLVLGAAVGCTFTGAPEGKTSPDPSPLSSQALNTATLPSRLLDVPEELWADVEATRGRDPTVLVEYWLDRPYTDHQEGWGWLLTVYQWDQAQFEENYSDVPGTWRCFAKDDTFYYVTAQATDVRVPASEEMVAEIPGATEVETRYQETFEAVKAFAEKAVLETEGVEPYSPDENRQPLDTLQARLMDVPEKWRDKVSAPDDIQEPSVLVYYWLDDPKWQDLSSGWLLTLYQMDEAGIQERLNQEGLWPAVDIFARSGDQYYALIWPSDGRYQNSNEFWDAVNAIKDHVKATVLATEGVEPFDPYTTPPHFFSNVPSPPLELGSYAIDGMDYTLVTSYEQVPEDPEQWYLVGQMGGYPVWMFTRDRGQETMFQVEDQLTQVFPYTARRFGGGQTHDGYAPQLMQLPGFGWGPKGTFGPFAVITHLFQGGADQQYQLTVYDLGTDAVTPYVHDWKALMKDFNMNRVVTLDEARHSAIISYSGQTVKLEFDEAEWANIQQYGFSAETYEYCMNYYFNDDGTFDLAMPVNPFTTDQIAVWTLRFTGNGFETRPASFRFVQSDDVYTYISTIH